jgi:hypothetical protein
VVRGFGSIAEKCGFRVRGDRLPGGDGVSWVRWRP